MRHTRKNSEAYRTLRIAWTEGVDISEIYDNTQEADYYTLTTAAGAKPIANLSDTPTSILGLISSLDGEKKPVVYIPVLTVPLKPTPLSKDETNLFIAPFKTTYL